MEEKLNNSAANESWKKNHAYSIYIYTYTTHNSSIVHCQ